MIKELQTCTRWQTCEVDRKNLLPIYRSIVSLFTNIHCCKHSIRICDVSLKLASKKIFFLKVKFESHQVIIEIQKLIFQHSEAAFACLRIAIFICTKDHLLSQEKFHICSHTHCTVLQLSVCQSIFNR